MYILGADDPMGLNAFYTYLGRYFVMYVALFPHSVYDMIGYGIVVLLSLSWYYNQLNFGAMVIYMYVAPVWGR